MPKRTEREPPWCCSPVYLPGTGLLPKIHAPSNSKSPLTKMLLQVGCGVTEPVTVGVGVVVTEPVGVGVAVAVGVVVGVEVTSEPGVKACHPLTPPLE